MSVLKKLTRNTVRFIQISRAHIMVTPVAVGRSLANGIVIASAELFTPGIAAAPNGNPDIDGGGGDPQHLTADSRLFGDAVRV